MKKRATVFGVCESEERILMHLYFTPANSMTKFFKVMIPASEKESFRKHFGVVSSNSLLDKRFTFLWEDGKVIAIRSRWRPWWNNLKIYSTSIEAKN